tara:strand:- start:307 stop:861 length:555 start_codon:yes stop_codon:yes gene_type:complete
MNKVRSEEFGISRTFIRIALAELFKINPLDIPLIAPPRLPPKLENDLGYLNLSHCKDAILIAWSTAKIGVDIEQSNRKIKFKNLANKIFNEKELKDIQKSNNYLSENFIKRWVVKESILKWQNNFKWSDCKNWYWNLGDNSATNIKSAFKLKIYQSNFFNWEFAISGELIKEDFNIICFDNYIN